MVQRRAPWWLDRVDQRQGPRDGLYHPAGNGAGVTIYVIDSGVRSTHEELAGRVLQGWDFVGDASGRARGAEDCHGHGTHVAALAAGTTVGLARGATIVPLRVVDCRGAGSVDIVLRAMRVLETQAHRPAVALFSSGYVDARVGTAATQLVRAGLAVVAAAGDDLGDACSVYPCSAAGVVCVAQTDDHDRQWPFSNGGPCVDLLAPGMSLASASQENDMATRVLSGSSQAAALAAGAAALALGHQPSASAADIAKALVQAATRDAVELARTRAGRGTANRLLFAGAG